MAVDELLLESAAGGGPPTLRLYAWDRPTLSLGYFQPLEAIPAVDRGRWPVVRRTTGGGAILHDREVTYAVAVPTTVIEGPELYAAINRAIVRAAAAFGVATEIRQPQMGERSQRGPFFCFARPGATDIIAASRKLAGGAQRKRREAILQHGSIVLEAVTPGAIGLSQLAGREVTFDRLAAEFVQAFEHEFAATTIRQELSPREQARAEVLRQERYANPEWLQNGNRKVDYREQQDH
jgi:lipoate-protein ligase A